MVAEFVQHAQNQLVHINESRFFTALAADKREIAVKHLFHFVNVGQQILLLLRIRQHCRLQFHARQRRAQIMRYPGQHLRTFADLTLNALLHFNKGNRRFPNFGRTVRFEILVVNAFTEIFGHLSQFGNRTNLYAQKQHGNQKQQH